YCYLDKDKSLIEELDKKIADKKDNFEKLDKKTMYLLFNEVELSTFGPVVIFLYLIYYKLLFKTKDDNVKSSKHGKN
ncbi:iron ABC transporter substrate-binding protein, partial [Staphylococcus haemolyticus]